MSNPIDDMHGDTIQVGTYAPGSVRPMRDGPVVMVGIEESGTGIEAVVHLTPTAARELIRDLRLAVKHL